LLFVLVVRSIVVAEIDAPLATVMPVVPPVNPETRETSDVDTPTREPLTSMLLFKLAVRSMVVEVINAVLPTLMPVAVAPPVAPEFRETSVVVALPRLPLTTMVLFELVVRSIVVAVIDAPPATVMPVVPVVAAEFRETRVVVAVPRLALTSMLLVELVVRSIVLPVIAPDTDIPVKLVA